MITLEDLDYDNSTEEDKKKILFAYIQYLLNLDYCLYKRELELCKSVFEVRRVYKEHTGEGSILRQIEKVLIESYKRDKDDIQKTNNQ